MNRHGIKKVVPDADTLGTAYRRALQIAIVQQQLPRIVAQASEQAQAAKIPKDLDKTVRRGFKADSAQSWDDVIATTARANCKKRAPDEPTSKQDKSPSGDSPNLTSCKKRAAGKPASKQAKSRSADADLTTAQREKQIFDMWLACRTDQQIAEAVGVDAETVSAVVQKFRDEHGQ